METTSLDPVLERWLAVHNLQLPVPAKVWGRVFPFQKGRFAWLPANGEEYVPQSLVHSGSILELALHPTKRADWLKRGAIAPLDAGLHFNLDDVFGEEFARYLRLSNIWTLEDVLANKKGDVLVGDRYIPIYAAAMVRQLAKDNADVVAAWMADARAYVEGTRTAVGETPKPRKAKKTSEGVEIAE